MSANSKMQSSAPALSRIRSYFSLRTSVLEHPPFRKLSHNSIFQGHFPKPPIACCLLSNARRSSTKLRSTRSEAAKVHMKHKQVLAEQAAGNLGGVLGVFLCGSLRTSA